MFVIARNDSGRPLLIHKMTWGARTVCNQEVKQWSRRYMNEVPEDSAMSVLLCKRCQRIMKS